MYLLAQRVRSRSRTEGINAFLSVHGGQPIPLRETGVPDIDFVSQFAGGLALANRQEVPAGGNAVLAYLDLVAEDNVAEHALAGAVAMIRNSIGANHMPITIGRDGVAARFATVVGLEKENHEQQRLLNELWDAAHRLLAQRNRELPDVIRPFIVWVGYSADGVQLWLPPVTLQRLPQSQVRRAHMLIPDDLLHETTPFNVLRESARALLGVSDLEVKYAGGIELVDPRAAKIVATFDDTSDL